MAYHMHIICISWILMISQQLAPLFKGPPVNGVNPAVVTASRAIAPWLRLSTSVDKTTSQGLPTVPQILTSKCSELGSVLSSSARTHVKWQTQSDKLDKLAQRCLLSGSNLSLRVGSGLVWYGLSISVYDSVSFCLWSTSLHLTILSVSLSLSLYWYLFLHVFSPLSTFFLLVSLFSILFCLSLSVLRLFGSFSTLSCAESLFSASHPTFP